MIFFVLELIVNFRSYGQQICLQCTLRRGLTRKDLYDTICMIRLTTFCIKICLIRFLKDRISSISSDLYEEILKPNESHTNRIIQIVPCKAAFAIID